MKYIKPLIVAATAAMMLTMSSCQLSKILPQKTETTDSTATPGVSFTLPTETTAGPMDLANADLSAYVTLGNYKGLTAEEKVVLPTDEEFEAELTTYINSIPVYEEITDRPAAQGDTVVMDYVGKLDGVPFAGGTAQGQSIELSENDGPLVGTISRATYYGAKVEYEVMLNSQPIIVEVYNPQLTRRFAEGDTVHMTLIDRCVRVLP